MTCEICGEKATYRFSPDLDIRGLGSCTKHRQDMHLAYVALLTGGGTMYKGVIANFRKADKKNKNNGTHKNKSK